MGPGFNVIVLVNKVKVNKKRRRSPRCFKCNKFGHVRNDCKNDSRGDQGHHWQKPNKNRSSFSRNEMTFAAFLSSPAVKNGSWYVDSCSSTHLTNENVGLYDKQNCNSMDITVANKQKIAIKTVGNVKIPPIITIIPITGYSVVFTPAGSYICDDEGTRLATMSEENGIYKLDTPKERVYFAAGTPNAEL
ncbi:hypothetical protein CBL_09640 [Carabus blaptoides fortunei]